ncbi:MAG TPA: [NiFe]-hydrogenase assembly chaperone HybE [Novimethylophilus sp.]|uniref:[NiFe]-hydrogenase assembly chaperone HybE n=1 Tax=Novimethylophilus sp. TaxID=2137426 RepID=UPI002F401732
MNGEHPAAELERVFAHIAATRMAGLPILNPALRVEAVGFRAWEGRWIGVLVTPWTISLVLLPGTGAPLEPLLLDQKRVWNFPSGAYQFMGLNEDELGACHICSLISPVAEFPVHEDAVAVAREAIAALFRETRAGHGEDLAGMMEDARLRGESLARKNLSRRDFLRVSFLRN